MPWWGWVVVFAFAGGVIGGMIGYAVACYQIGKGLWQ